MREFFIPLTVASTGATILVNPDHIIFIREVSDGTQLVTTVINEGAVLPIVKEKVEEVYRMCKSARARHDAD